MIKAKQIIAVCAALLAGAPFAFPQSLKMETLSVADGLSSNVVYDIVQDNAGYIWFATDKGLDRYDGRNFKNYLYACSDESIGDARINCLFLTDDGTLLIGTEKGVNRYDPLTDQIMAAEEMGAVAYENIRTISQFDYSIWIGTNHGLYRYFLQSGKWSHIDTTNSSLVNDIVRAVFVDDGYVFIGTFDGLSCFNQNTGHWDNIRLKPEHINYPANNLVLSVVQSPYDEESLLIGTQTGLCELNKLSLKFTVHERGNTQSMVNNTVKTMCRDGRNVWLGSEEGLMIYDGENFSSFTYEPNDIYSLPSNIIWKIIKDRNGVMWLATEGGAVKCNANIPTFATYDLAGFEGNPYTGLEIFGACIDREGNTWLGSRKGLSVCGLESRSMRWIDLSNTVSGTYNFTKGLVVDSNDILWVGTAEGVVCYDLKLDREIPIQNRLNRSLKYINTVALNSDGDIYIAGALGQVQIVHYDFDTVGRRFRTVADETVQFDRPFESMAVLGDYIYLGSTGDGLLRYDTTNGEITKYYHSEDEHTPSSNIIQCLYADSLSNSLWIGTTSGLDRYDIAAERIDRTTEKEAVNGVYTINSDLHGHIWFSTANSVCCYDVASGKFKFFTLSKWFEYRNSILSSSTSAGGDVYMFGLDKCIRLNSTDVLSETYPVPLLVTDINILNQPLSDLGLNRQPVGEITSLKLNHDQNIISIGVAMLDYSSPEMIKYSYFLEGYDDKWRVLNGSASDIEYTNLHSGTYNFYVKAVNGEGIAAANDIAVEIVVRPPWWQLWWMQLIYVVVFVSVVWFFYHSYKKRTEAEHQLEKERMARESIDEMNKLKLSLFTNISHDLKTPLSLILSPCESLIDNENDETKLQNLRLIKQNAQRLLVLVNQILEFRKVDSQKMDVKLKSNDFIKTLSAVCTNFQEIAAKKSVVLQFESTLERLVFDYDEDKVERIFFNLVSNAIKFTPNGGQILMHVQQKDFDCIEVMVADTGVGIDTKDLPHIFERFYQAENAAIIYNSSGLGLVIVKEFVELLGGTVTVSSDNNTGTTFIVTLPIVNPQTDDTAAVEIETETDDSVADPTTQRGGIGTVLLIEDNEDLRTYLTGELGKIYNVVAEEDAESALNYINTTLPAIIIMDIMLPGIDGLTLCRKLKSEFITSHIPIILLTARTADEQVIEGYDAGADEYIGKPFNLKVLLSRMDNIIVQRQKFRDTLKRNMELSVPADVQSPDEIFLHKVMTLINDNLSDPDLNIPALCDKLAVSPVNFCRKMKSITDMNPNAFIRDLRLKRAAQLLCVKGMTVTDVMYDVGFNHRSYFSMCFREAYGVTPKTWANQHHNRSEQGEQTANE